MKILFIWNIFNDKAFFNIRFVNLLMRTNKMDKFRITYQCNKVPNAMVGLEGFEIQKKYVGRTFNGFFEISPKWGSGNQTKMISKVIFQEFFEIIKDIS